MESDELVELHFDAKLGCQLVEVIMRLVQQVDDGNIATDLSNGEAKGQTKTTTATGDDNGAALERDEVVDSPRQELVRVAVEGGLASGRRCLRSHGRRKSYESDYEVV